MIRGLFLEMPVSILDQRDELHSLAHITDPEIVRGTNIAFQRLLPTMFQEDTRGQSLELLLLTYTAGVHGTMPLEGSLQICGG